MVDEKQRLMRRELALERLKYRKIRQAVNALLRRQMVCGKLCCNCAEKCKELQAWLDLEK